MPIFNKFCKFSEKISDISPRFCKIQTNLTIICDLPQFRQNSVKIAAKMTDLNEKSAKFSKNHEESAKINGAKDCKFEIGAVQRNANLVDLKNPCKMSLWSLSELSIQPRTSLLKFEEGRVLSVRHFLFTLFYERRD